MAKQTLTLTLDANEYHELMNKIGYFENELYCEETCSFSKEEYAARADIRTKLYDGLREAHRKLVRYLDEAEDKIRQENLKKHTDFVVDGFGAPF